MTGQELAGVCVRRDLQGDAIATWEEARGQRDREAGKGRGADRDGDSFEGKGKEAYAEDRKGGLYILKNKICRNNFLFNSMICFMGGGQKINKKNLHFCL